MTERLGESDDPSSKVALLIRAVAYPILKLYVSPRFTINVLNCTYHRFASEIITDSIGPPKVLDVFIFNALYKNGLVTKVQTPRCMKCRLN
jgi:hypothetical protein